MVVIYHLNIFNIIFALLFKVSGKRILYFNSNLPRRLKDLFECLHIHDKELILTSRTESFDRIKDYFEKEYFNKKDLNYLDAAVAQNLSIELEEQDLFLNFLNEKSKLDPVLLFESIFIDNIKLAIDKNSNVKKIFYFNRSLEALSMQLSISSKALLLILKLFFSFKMEKLNTTKFFFSGYADFDIPIEEYDRDFSWFTKFKIVEKSESTYIVSRTQKESNLDKTINITTRNDIISQLGFFEKIRILKKIARQYFIMTFNFSRRSYLLLNKYIGGLAFAEALMKLNCQSYIITNSCLYPENEEVPFLREAGIDVTIWFYSGVDFYFSRNANFVDKRVRGSITISNSFLFWNSSSVEQTYFKRIANDLIQTQCFEIGPMMNGNPYYMDYSREQLLSILNLDTKYLYIGYYEQPLSTPIKISEGHLDFPITEKEGQACLDLMISLVSKFDSIRIIFKGKKPTDFNFPKELEKIKDKVTYLSPRIDQYLGTMLPDIGFGPPITSAVVARIQAGKAGFFYDLNGLVVNVRDDFMRKSILNSQQDVENMIKNFQIVNHRNTHHGANVVTKLNSFFKAR